MPFFRTIEKKIRRATLNALGSSGRIGPEDSPPLPLPGTPRILLLRIDRIGDAIISTPVLQLLRRHFPHGVIDVLLSEKNRVVAPLLPAVDNVYILEKKLPGTLRTIRQLRRNRYHAVVNLHLNRSASASLVGSLARAGVLIESPAENAFAESPGTPAEHVVPLTAHLLKPLGVERITGDSERQHPLRLELPPDAIANAEKILRQLVPGGRFLLVNVSATHISRNWPPKQWAALAELLRRRGMPPVICGAPADWERVEEIAATAGALPLPPLRNYADFAAVVAGATAVITPDTSTVHLAAALGRPTLPLYGSAKTAHAWRPWGVPHRILLNPAGMEKIQPEDVVSALEQLLLSGTGDDDVPARESLL